MNDLTSRIRLVVDDITRLDVDAVVTAANASRHENTSRNLVSRSPTGHLPNARETAG